MKKHPSRNVTRSKTCVVCGKKFKPPRRDARFCSAACRQKAHRARSEVDDIDKQIIAARLLYWELMLKKALAAGVDMSQVVTDDSHYVDEQGNVFRGFPGKGVWAGKTTPENKGWTTFGSDAAGPPFNPPPRPGQRQRNG